MRPRVRPAVLGDEIRQAAARLPPSLRLGATSWTTPQWDCVWERPASAGVLAREGIGAYAEHPMLRTVLIDRAARMPLHTAGLAGLAASVPADFRFVLAADEWVLRGRLPDHPRFGEARGQANPAFLNADAMIERSVTPFVEGLGERGGILLLTIPRQDPRALGTRRAFPSRLGRFLSALPQGPRYAVELRDHKLLTSEYAAVLAETGALHCISVHPSMERVQEQLTIANPLSADTVIVRWSMGVHLDYRAAFRNFSPFNALVDRDLRARNAVLEVVRRASQTATAIYALVDDMAEGCAPATIVELSESLLEPS